MSSLFFYGLIGLYGALTMISAFQMRHHSSWLTVGLVPMLMVSCYVYQEEVSLAQWVCYGGLALYIGIVTFLFAKRKFAGISLIYDLILLIWGILYLRKRSTAIPVLLFAFIIYLMIALILILCTNRYTYRFDRRYEWLRVGMDVFFSFCIYASLMGNPNSPCWISYFGSIGWLINDFIKSMTRNKRRDWTTVLYFFSLLVIVIGEML